MFVTFTLNNRSQLRIHYRATANMDTVLTNHSYFNLAGESSGAAYNQLVQINASHYMPTGATQIPTGVIAPVQGTPFDFTRPHTIGSRINVDNQQLLIAQGYDHNRVLNNSGPKLGGLRLAACARDLAPDRPDGRPAGAGTPRGAPARAPCQRHTGRLDFPRGDQADSRARPGARPAPA